jgi:hypothetical protein
MHDVIKELKKPQRALSCGVKDRFVRNTTVSIHNFILSEIDVVEFFARQNTEEVFLPLYCCRSKSINYD